MLTGEKSFVLCGALLMALILWIAAPTGNAARYNSVEPETARQEEQAKPGPAGAAKPMAVPGRAPDFRADSVKAVSLFEAIRSHVFTKALFRWAERLQPNQGGIIWLAIIVTVLIAFDFRKVISWRNLDILLLLLPGFLLIDLIHLGADGRITDPAQKSLFGMVFLGIFLVSLALLIRALVGAFNREARSWTPNLPSGALAILIVILLACNAILALGRSPDDCGYYTNIGAKRMLETGKFPYGDPMLRGGAAATYGPVLYIAHIPFQIGISLVGSNVEARERLSDNGSVPGDGARYVGPPVLATKLTLLFFHFMGVAGLIMVGRRLAGLAVGLALACLYIGSAYVQGLGGETHFIGGMTFISHIAPAATTVLAFSALGRPFLAGTLLAVATGVLFYPAFFFPLWLGYYFWRGKEWRKFAAGFLIVCSAIGAGVLLMTHSSEDVSAIQAIYESTVGHQEAKHAYGSSVFSFWGTHPELADFWQRPFIEGWYLLKPSFLIFAFFIGASFFMARGRTAAQLALLTAAVAIAIQLWKSHAGGTYIEWYYPFLLIGLFAQRESGPINRPVRNSSAGN